STHMGDGWETKRRRGPGHEWSIVRLARRGVIERVELDTDHYKGNAPGQCSLEMCDTGPQSSPASEASPGSHPARASAGPGGRPARASASPGGHPARASASVGIALRPGQFD